MLKIIKIIVDAVFNLLPDSPFQSMIDSVIFDKELLPFLNWFLPFDICAKMTLTWLGCILVYYTFVLVKKIVFDFIINKVIAGIAVALGGISG